MALSIFYKVCKIKKLHIIKWLHESFHFDDIDMQKIIKDNILLKICCSHMDQLVDVAIWLYTISENYINYDTHVLLFKGACAHGNCFLAQLLNIRMKINKSNIIENNNDLFKIVCINGYFDVVVYLYYEYNLKINEITIDETTIECCEITKWLHKRKMLFVH